MQKSHIYILIILAVGFFLAFQYQINKMDRKLTCIYNSINVLPYFIVPELRTADPVAHQEQIKLVESTCDKGYIFLGGFSK